MQIDPAELQSFIDSYEASYRAYARDTAGQTVLRISYEELVSHRTGTMRRLFDFLGLPNDHIPPPLEVTVVQHVKPVREAVSNWDDLAYAFHHTKYVPEAEFKSDPEPETEFKSDPEPEPEFKSDPDPELESEHEQYTEVASALADGQVHDDRRRKKVVVCGGAGFIGSHLAKKLKKDGNYVVVADM